MLFVFLFCCSGLEARKGGESSSWEQIPSNIARSMIIQVYLPESNNLVITAAFHLSCPVTPASSLPCWPRRRPLSDQGQEQRTGLGPLSAVTVQYEKQLHSQYLLCLGLSSTREKVLGFILELIFHVAMCIMGYFRRTVSSICCISLWVPKSKLPLDLLPGHNQRSVICPQVSTAVT